MTKQCPHKHLEAIPEEYLYVCSDCYGVCYEVTDMTDFIKECIQTAKAVKGKLLI